MSGGSLEQLIADKSRDLSWPVRIRLACDVAKGLKYVHGHGIMHRDLTSKVSITCTSTLICFYSELVWYYSPNSTWLITSRLDRFDVSSELR